MSKLSVIVIGYNIEKYVEKCLKSLQVQTYKNLEIIFIDDGSEDNTYTIVKEISKTMDNLKVFTKKNGGPGAARNYGLKECNGEYITFVDGDDFLEKDAYQKAMEKIILEKTDLCIFGYKKIYDNKVKNISINKSFYKLPDIKRDILSKSDDTSIFLWNKIFKKDIIVKNEIFLLEQKYFEDNSFIYRYLFFTNKISILEREYLYNYIQRTGSLTKSLDLDIIKQKETTIEKMRDFYQKESQLSNYLRELEDLEVRYDIYIYRKFIKLNAKEKGKKLEEKLKKIKLKYILIETKIPLKHKIFLILLKYALDL